MTIWSPELPPAGGPVYLALADQLDRDVAAGRLAPGTRLPTHRALARRLRVTVGTVTRAYGEAERRGLVSGEVGRGTFVRRSGDAAAVLRRAPAGELPSLERALGGGPGLVDLAVNIPPEPGDEAGTALAGTLADLAAEPALGELLRYGPHAGLHRHRAAGAAWIAAGGLPAAPERIVVTAGSQHALVVALGLARPGEVVLAEALTYPGVHAAARLLGLDLHGLPLDDEGIVPAAVERAARELGARLLYLVPTIQNPTGAVMSPARRAAIAAVARRLDLIVIEDDIHGRLPEEAPRPLAAWAPERTVHVANLSKSVAPGLRIGFVLAPEALVDRLAATVGATLWMASPLQAEVAARWIVDGTALRLLEARRRESMARQRLAAEVLAGLDVSAHPCAHHLWLRLPPGRSPEDLAARARARGVAVAPASAFAAPPLPPPAAVRLTLGAARDQGELRRALETVRELALGPLASSVAPSVGLL